MRNALLSLALLAAVSVMSLAPEKASAWQPNGYHYGNDYYAPSSYMSRTTTTFTDATTTRFHQPIRTTLYCIMVPIRRCRRSTGTTQVRRDTTVAISLTRRARCTSTLDTNLFASPAASPILSRRGRSSVFHLQYVSSSSPIPLEPRQEIEAHCFPPDTPTPTDHPIPTR